MSSPVRGMRRPRRWIPEPKPGFERILEEELALKARSTDPLARREARVRALETPGAGLFMPEVELR